MESIRHCKKCGCELSDETKGDYCINCKTDKKIKLRNIGIVAASVLAVSASVAKAVLKKH
ncbi:MAG TPA: hypothetical protein DD377_06710 [Firmicutes bacterium]|nr:hypothetical protein [Bacillota bacterium]